MSLSGVPKFEDTGAGRTLEATQASVAAAIASGIIAASGRPFSINEALEVYKDVRFSMYPKPEFGGYHAWLKTVDRDKPVT